MTEVHTEKELHEIKTGSADEGEETAVFNEAAMRDYRQHELTFLSALGRWFPIGRFLYLAAGYDRIPDRAIPGRVVETSLEDFRGDKNYFPQLGYGLRAVADNNALPFRDSSFRGVLVMDNALDVLGDPFTEPLRVLRSSGIVVFSRNIFEGNKQDNPLYLYQQSPLVENMAVPECFQSQGESNAEFFIFRKK